ncbi:unnamed protein product, partial [Ixodes hexagonus]
SSLEVEIEALKAIYIHELQVTYNDRDRPTSLRVSLHPATADNAEEQYVRLELVLDLLPEYPSVLPEVTIRNPRGLSDEKIERIHRDVQETARENTSSPMLYQLIEVAKDHLTEENVPCCQCTICLYGFAEGDVFTKTQCYHYFHSHCLGRYVSHALSQMRQDREAKLSPAHEPQEPSDKVGCPVCRLPLSVSEMSGGQDHPPPKEQARQPEFSLSPALEQLQRDMASLFRRQQTKGGIINMDAEKNKFLLDISAAPEGSGTIAEIPKRFIGGPFKFRNLGNPTTRPTDVAVSATKVSGSAGPPCTDDVDRRQARNLGPPVRNRHRRFGEAPRNSTPVRYNEGTEEADGSTAGVERTLRPDRQQCGPRAYFSKGRGGHYRPRPRPEQRPRREDFNRDTNHTSGEHSSAQGDVPVQDRRAEQLGTHRQSEPTSSFADEQSKPWNGASHPRGGRRHGGRGGWALGKRQQPLRPPQQSLRNQAPSEICSGTEDR